MVATIVTLMMALRPGPGPVSFKADVAPILAAKCLGCHNDRKASGGLNMKTFALLKKGGRSGGAETIVAGDPDSSYLVETIRPGAEPRMPMKLSPLSAEQIGTIERWVREGARFDGASETATTLASIVDPLAGLPKVAVKSPTSDPVTSVTFAKDGSTVAAAVGRAVALFDPGTGRAVATLEGHPGPVTSVVITADGRTLVASGGRAGQFGSVVVWDLATKARRHDLRGHADAILAADLSPDGTTLATASYDRTVRLWDLATGRESRTLKEHTDAVHAVAFSRDGSRLATAGADRTVKVWEPVTGRRIVSLSDSTGEVYAVAFDPSGKIVYAAGVDRSIRAWELSGQGGALVRSVFAHDAAVLRLAIAPDGKTVVSTGEDRAVKSWSLPGLRPLADLGSQPDWPQAVAFSPDGSRLAIGRYDGSLALVESSTGKAILALRDAPGVAPPGGATKPKPQLVRNATLNPPSPRGALRGTKVRLVLSGQGAGGAVGVYFEDPGLVPTIIPAAKPDPNRLEVDLAIGNEVEPGAHRFTVQSPLGVPAPETFIVCEHPEVAESEPNDDPRRLKPTTLPATLLGTIDRPGDSDSWRFEGKAGRSVVFEIVGTGATTGPKLDPVLTLVDAAGKPFARAASAPHSPSPVLSATITSDGPVTLIVSDAQYGGSASHAYRINAGPLPRVSSTFPMALPLRSVPADRLKLMGVNLGPDELSDGSERDRVAASAHGPGAILPIRRGKGGRSLVSSRSAVLTEGIPAVESGENDSPTQAEPVAIPGGTSGRIERAGDVDFFRFEAKKGRRVILEVFGRRLGSPIDPVIEVLDAQGRAIPRAVLRPVEETKVAFRDHPSTIRGIRLTKWDDLAMKDYLLVGRELVRLEELPRNPDDDAVFWGIGDGRTNAGERLAFCETTPEQHPLGQPMWKVEIHPPGSAFQAGGMAPVTLHYRNDDGGPGFGKDARITFDPPADGTYLVRVEDVRGLGGEDFGYHLLVRPPHPDFAVSLRGGEDPEVPRGGAAVVRIDLLRKDGFDDAVEVEAVGLPPGVTATTARIEPEAYTADLLLMADASAPAFSPPTWRLVAQSAGRSSGERVIRHESDPGGPSGGRITVTPEPDLKVTASADRVVIRPGERVDLTLNVARSPAFSGRVPIEVRNLPIGVRVLNIGLNGVLVTESQVARPISLYAEPWVSPADRSFYAVGRVEAASADSSSPPIRLIVAPTGPGDAAAAGRP